MPETIVQREKRRGDTQLPEEIAPIVHLNVQVPDQHNRAEAVKQAHFDEATLTPHYSKTDQI